MKVAGTAILETLSQVNRKMEHIDRPLKAPNDEVQDSAEDSADKMREDQHECMRKTSWTVVVVNFLFGVMIGPTELLIAEINVIPRPTSLGHPYACIWGPTIIFLIDRGIKK